MQPPAVHNISRTDELTARWPIRSGDLTVCIGAVQYAGGKPPVIVSSQDGGMPARERRHAAAGRRADMLIQRLAADARSARLDVGVSQAQIARVIGVSRNWVGRFERGAMARPDLRTLVLLYACLGQKLVVNAYPTGAPLRDAAHAALLARFSARLNGAWRQAFEVPMPAPGDLRAWDAVLRGPVSIGVEAETRPRDLQRLERSMTTKQRNSGVDRVVLLLLASGRNRGLVREHVAQLRQAFPLDTRSTLDALAAGRDPGANGLVLL